MILLLDNYDSFTYNLYQFIAGVESEISGTRIAIISFPSLNGYIICLNTRKINRNFLRLIFQLILSVFFCYSSSFPVIAQNLH